ncbi:MAG: hypothetical protein KJ887_01185 [Candidatus Omnitrophica bacterium]|nr:hypothetical protein [Candidatus Omnitrophota bacterium]MBU1047271.1 hypothetical protein [Candidatus Omnitrophota bacterium]MBU1630995.1 hypothetical protein [Candidatus Omnitrophota bacterium]MBU1889144.1 hypothetical protein [Candidatus Omnitrophota bacterium]
MIEDKNQEVVAPPIFKDRKGGLIAFGIIQIILGSFFILVIPLMLIGMSASSAGGQSNAMPMPPQLMAQVIIFYLLMAIWFISMGIGSINARRWARALILISSWFWFIFGIVGFIFWLIFMQNIYGQMAVNGQMPPTAIAIVKVVTIIFMIIFYIVVPGIIILFYGSRNVKTTCESRNPNPSWTDKCPLPVLGLSVLFAISPVSMIQMASYNFLIAFFGSLISGAAGAGVSLIIVLLLIYIAIGFYKLQIKAWWTAIAVIVIGTLSTIITFSRINLLEFYQKMNFPEQQMEIIKQMGMIENSNIFMTWIPLFYAVVIIGYLLYIKKYFTPVAELGEGKG